MSTPIDALPGSVCKATDEKSVASTPASSNSASGERLRLQRLASEFESMLLNQVLQEMRRAGKWNMGDEDEGAEGTGLGAGALFEILDGELSKQLSASKGFGLSSQLMEAFDRIQGTSGTTAAGIGDQDADPVPAAALPGSHDRTSAAGSFADRSDLDGAAAVAAAGRQVTSGYGWRRDPFTGETRMHRGVDLRAAYGEDVTASAGGRIAFSGAQGSFGNTVVVEHANGTRTRYAHLSVVLVRDGDTVEPGQVVGRAGSTGRATAPHLHVEVTDRHGRHLNPLLPPEPHD